MATEKHRANVSPPDLVKVTGHLCIWYETGGGTRYLKYDGTRWMLTVCVCLMRQLSRAEMNSPTLAPGTSGLEKELGRGEIPSWEEGLQLYQRLVRWGKTATPTTTTTFDWHVQINSFSQPLTVSGSQSVPSPNSDRWVELPVSWQYVWNWRLVRLCNIFIDSSRQRV